MHAHAAQVVNLYVDNPVGQPELRYAILQHSANLVESLKHVDIIALLGHVARKAQSGRARSHHGNLHAVGRGHLGQYYAEKNIVEQELIKLYGLYRLWNGKSPFWEKYNPRY